MKFEGSITPGKIVAVLILLVGCYTALELKDSSVAIIALSITGGLYGWRKMENRKIIQLKNGKA